MEDTGLSKDSLLTTQQVAELSQRSLTSVLNWTDQGQLPSTRTEGGHRRVRADDLAAFLTQRRMQIPPELELLARRRVLFVDDHEVVLRSVQRLLAPYDRQVEVRTCDNGIAALIEIGDFKPHIIVLDVYMPEVRGIDICRRLKQDPRTKDTKIVVMSGQLREGDEQEAVEAGADAILDKPFNTKTILDLLEIEPLVPK